MADVTSEAYLALRQLWVDQIATISVRNGSEEMIRQAVTAPSPEDDVMRYTIDLTGADFTNVETNNVDVDRSVLLTADDTEWSVAQFKPFTFEFPQDELAITHDIRLPGGTSMMTGIVWMTSHQQMVADDFQKLIVGSQDEMVNYRVVGSVIQQMPIGASFVIAAREQRLGLRRDVGDAWLRVVAPTFWGANVNLTLEPGSSITCWKLDDGEEGRVLYGVGTQGVRAA